MRVAISENLFVRQHTIREDLETVQKIEAWAIAGLLADGGHHKQYCLEQILIALGVDLEGFRTKLLKDDYDWEPGIAP